MSTLKETAMRWLGRPNNGSTDAYEQHLATAFAQQFTPEPNPPADFDEYHGGAV